MFDLPFAQVWALWPMASEALRAKLVAVMQSIASGPIEDAKRAGLPVERRGNVAIVGLRGVIIKQAGMWQRYGFADSDVQSIVMLIDSTDPPGESMSMTMD